MGLIQLESEIYETRGLSSPAVFAIQIP